MLFADLELSRTSTEPKRRELLRQIETLNQKEIEKSRSKVLRAKKQVYDQVRDCRKRASEVKKQCSQQIRASTKITKEIEQSMRDRHQKQLLEMKDKMLREAAKIKNWKDM